MPYRDTPFDPSPYAGSIGDLMLHSNDAAARAAEIVAQAQGRALETKAAARANMVRAIASVPAQFDAMKDARIDRQAKMTALADANDQRQQALAQRTTQVVGRIFRSAKTAQEAKDGLTYWAKNGGIPTEAGGTVLALLDAAGDDPTKFTALQTHFVSLGNATETPQKLGEGDVLVQGANPDGTPNIVGRGAAKPKTREELAADAADPTSPTAAASKAALSQLGVGPKTPNTEAELAADAANPQSPTAAQSKQALDLLRLQKNPPSLEDQYLAAKAAGKEDAANLILQTWRDKADASRDPQAQAQLEAIRRLSQQEAQARLEDRDLGSDKNQSKFEQEYRTVLTRAMSSRSGGVGLEDAKVQQANHLTALMDQYFDPKTGEYTVPPAQYSELALGLARLLSPSGQVGIQLEQEIKQGSAAGDLAKLVTYVTGTPVTGSTQAIFKNLRDSIERQGAVAQTNREGEMGYLRGLAPTDLKEDRRTKLEATSLNPLRQSRVIQNKQTGERKLQTSVDGGQTWK